MMHGWNGWMGWGSGMGIVWMLLLVGLIVAAAVAIARALIPRPGGPRDAGEDDALLVLRARYARDEIDEDEYRARRSILSEASGGRP